MKTLVIGIDGATFDIIMPMIRNGELRYLKEFVEKGCHGYLKSVFPPITFPAWISFRTGKNPGKHGVFGFIETSYAYEKSKVVSSKSVSEPSIWQILSDEGYKVGVLNMPASYPPECVNGIFVSGLGTPSIHSDFTYPKELKEILISNFNYKFDWIPYERGKEDAFVNELIEATEIMGDVACYLVDKYKFDFFMVVFMAVDTIQHAFWGYRDKSHPLYTPDLAKYGHMIEEMYKVIDKQIGKILKTIENGPPNIFVVSDHGFGSMLKEVYMDEFLESVGMLKWESSSKAAIIKWKIFDKILKFRRRSDLMRYILSKIPKKTKDNISKVFMRKIDMSQTRAYSGGYFGKIYINAKNSKEYNEIVSKLQDIFHQWRDPETGERIVDRIYRKEEIYWGKYIDIAPDLTVILKDFSYVDFPRYREGKIFYPPRQGGTHRLNGIFIAYGSDIKEGYQVENINIYDVTPTILHLFDLPIPSDMDGQVLIQIFRKNSEIAVRNPKFIKYYKATKEVEIIRSKIRKLKI